ncbi:hypothetical protein ACHAWF_018682 [Thalassiosira exigua]
MTQSERERSRAPVVGIIPKDKYQEMFKAATEKTSSNSTEGMNYSIWKALASDDECAEFLCVMLSMPFLFGFVNPRWLNEIDVMLEKKKGVRWIHVLRIIGLLEADFNTALKYFFSCAMMQNAEANGLSDEQWGSRNNRTAIDAGFKKLLTYENARVMKSTMAEGSHDVRACYDMMAPSQSNVYAQKHNVSGEICECVAKTKEGIRHHVKTGLGVSTAYYKQDKDGIRFGGEIQGTGDAPPKYITQSSVGLETLAKVAPGLVMKGCDGTKEIKHHGIMYVDDKDGHVSDPRAGPEAASEVVNKLQQQCNSYSNTSNFLI